MNVCVLLSAFVLTYVLVVALLWEGDREAPYVNPHFGFGFKLPDGALAGVGRFTDTVKIAVNSDNWEVVKLYYDGPCAAVNTVFVGNTCGIWKLSDSIGDFSVSVRKHGESQPYFLNVRRDLTGKWETSISRF